MWSWMAEFYNPDWDTVPVAKEEYFEVIGIPEDEQPEERCFFCEYARHFNSESEHGCVLNKCPGTLVDDTFDCHNSDYDYEGHPVEFYAELVRLHRIYLEQRVEQKNIENPYIGPQYLDDNVAGQGDDHA